VRGGGAPSLIDQSAIRTPTVFSARVSKRKLEDKKREQKKSSHFFLRRWERMMVGPMWRPGNLFHLVAWFVSLLYSVLRAALSRAPRRPAPAAVPGWLLNGTQSFLFGLFFVCTKCRLFLLPKRNLLALFPSSSLLNTPGDATPPAALVTGGGSGIGRAVAADLARLGLHVIVACRTLPEVREKVSISPTNKK
jgi:hypothetical protein